MVNATNAPVTATASAPAATSNEIRKISRDRLTRLYRLVRSLAEAENAAVSRRQLLKKLKVGLRTFYRDVDLLRSFDIRIDAQDQGYRLGMGLDDALMLLPFPDPELTFGEIAMLMKGNTKAHIKLKKLYDRLTK